MHTEHTGKRVVLRWVLCLGAMLSGVGVCSAAPIVYNIGQTIGSGSVTGTITTDGAFGVLATADITGWNLLLTGVGATFGLTGANSVALVSGVDLTATATQLLFNFGGADNGYLLFQVNLFSGSQYYCDATSAGVCFQGASVVPQSIFDSSAQHVPVNGNVVIATAPGPVNPVPEPSTYALMLASLAAVGLASRRCKNA